MLPTHAVLSRSSIGIRRAHVDEKGRLLAFGAIQVAPWRTLTEQPGRSHVCLNMGPGQGSFPRKRTYNKVHMYVLCKDIYYLARLPENHMSSTEWTVPPVFLHLLRELKSLTLPVGERSLWLRPLLITRTMLRRSSKITSQQTNVTLTINMKLSLECANDTIPCIRSTGTTVEGARTTPDWRCDR